MKHIGYMVYRPKYEPNGEFAKQSLTKADRKEGWTQAKVYQEGEPK